MADQLQTSDTSEPLTRPTATRATPILRRLGLDLKLARLPLWVEVLAAGLVLAPGTTIIYQLAAALNAGAVVPQWLDTPIDQQLMVVPSAIWVYLSWYPAMIMLPTLGGRLSVRRGAAAVVVAFVVCSLGHVLLPVSIHRPLIDPSAGTSAQLLAWFYSFDPPRNLFPSFHAAGAVLLAPLQRSWVTMGTVAVWAVALCVSCVLVKQHFVIDVLAGAAVGLASAVAAKRMIPEPFCTE